MKMVLYTDGGARGNPGPAAAGIILKNDSNKVVKELGSYLGVCTNNEAEYKALLLGLEAAKESGATQLESYLDSELVVKQLKGEYKVKKDALKHFWNKVQDVIQAFEKVEFRHVKRDKNYQADKLVNKVLDAID